MAFVWLLHWLSPGPGPWLSFLLSKPLCWAKMFISKADTRDWGWGDNRRTIFWKMLCLWLTFLPAARGDPCPSTLSLVPVCVSETNIRQLFLHTSSIAGMLSPELCSPRDWAIRGFPKAGVRMGGQFFCLISLNYWKCIFKQFVKDLAAAVPCVRLVASDPPGQHCL